MTPARTGSLPEVPLADLAKYRWARAGEKPDAVVYLGGTTRRPVVLADRKTARLQREPDPAARTAT
jgi:hypothetical protein